jgi:tetratricopeptide (TPR) repeat protein
MAYQFILAAARNNMGCMLGNVLARPEEGLAEHRQAREIYQKLVENHPAHRDAYHALACSHTNAADCLLALGRRDEARKGFEQGVAMHEKLLKDYPALPLYRRDLGYSLNHFALTRAPAEAAAGVRQARELYLSLPARSPTEWAELASSHALLAGLAAKSESGVTAGEGRASADAAMDALRQAVKNGFRSGDTLRVDPAYAVLRRRDDFQALLKDLEAKLAPKTP